MAVLYIRDPVTKAVTPIPSVVGPQGPEGTNPYDYAVASGYTGTTEEFAADLAALSGLSTELDNI